MCCVFLDIYSPVQRNNNEKKKKWMCSSLVEKPMRASGMEYDIDCWLFSPTPLLLLNYYNLLHVSQPLCGGHCITALFHTLNRKQSCDTGGV